ncbi:MAG: RNA polymerase sigma factor [bacterium]|nr:RNA polymerase sigma factor [bacterium]
MTRTQEMERQDILTLAHHDFEKRLTTHAYFKVNDHKMSEDLVQDTFLKTWNYLARGGKIEVMKAFLYHILNHLIVDQYRKHKTYSLDTLVEKGFEPSTGEHARLVNLLDGKAALLLIAQLPPAYQKVLRMRYMQDLSLQEMSRLTGQTKNALAVQVHRGLGKLKILHTSARGITSPLSAPLSARL